MLNRDRLNLHGFLSKLKPSAKGKHGNIRTFYYAIITFLSDRCLRSFQICTYFISVGNYWCSNCCKKKVVQVSTELGKIRGVGKARDIKKQKHIENYPKRVGYKDFVQMQVAYVERIA